MNPAHTSHQGDVRFIQQYRVCPGAGGYAWIPLRDPSLLDFPRCELLLIGAKPEAEGAHHLAATVPCK